jgi:hypothetical protein
VNKLRGKQIGEASKRRKRKIVEEVIASYYDGRSLQGLTEETELGNFSLSQLMNETD